MRLSGKICCSCSRSLPPPHQGGERYCAECSVSRTARHLVYMSFMLRDGWYCQFLERDLKTPLPRKLSLKDVGKIYELAQRGNYSMNTEGRHALDHAIEMGRGGIWLELTDEQYAKLKKR